VYVVKGEAVASTRDPLDRDAIVARGVAFADEHGTDALSMRKLAAELGYEVMSLYNHVANKAEVLSLMVDAVAAEIPPPTPTPIRSSPSAASPSTPEPHSSATRGRRRCG
jgi:AcrR family transcriptional regulator